MADPQQESHQRLLEGSQPSNDADEQTQMQQGADEATPPQLSEAAHRHHCRRLYLSHALSTWNSRLFEFGAFLFLANIYPNTLLPASVYALARAASAALLSPCLGSYIDRADRLRAVRLSISTMVSICVQRVLLMSRSWAAPPSSTLMCRILHSPHTRTMGTVNSRQDAGIDHSVCAGLYREAQCSPQHSLSGTRLDCSNRRN